MNKLVFVVGMGQLGAIFAEGFLKQGRVIVPILRGQSLEAGLAQLEPELILLAVGEDDLPSALAEVPDVLKDRVVLIQNELRPDQWLKHEAYQKADPSVAIVWFEKKAGKLPHVVQPTLLYGPGSELLSQALGAMELPCRVIETEADLVFELALKNLYILGLNFGGLSVGGTAGELLGEHGDMLKRVGEEIIDLEEALLSKAGEQGARGATLSALKLDRKLLWAGLSKAIEADPTHGCSGRSAPRRLARTLEYAKSVGLELPSLSQLSQRA